MGLHMCRVFFNGTTKIKKSSKCSKWGSEFLESFLMGLQTLVKVTVLHIGPYSVLAIAHWL
jgi:hypothetical protein